MARPWLLLLLTPAVLHTGECENQGWQKYFTENIEEFHDLPLAWQQGSQVPSWLYGTYIRNGAARISFGSSRRVSNSWLDGWAKLHSFKFDGDSVLFSGKMLEPPNYLESVEAGELVPQTTLNRFEREDEEWTLAEKLKIAAKVAVGTGFQNTNPALWRLGHKSIDKGIYLAVTDSPVPMRFNITDLSSLGLEYPTWYPLTFSGCAHYVREVGTDNSINFMRKKRLTGKPYVEVQRYRPEHIFQAPEVVGEFVPEKLSSVHSFSVTEDYAVFFFYPAVIDAKKYWAANFHVFELLDWLEGQPTDIYVMDLKTGNTTQLQTGPIYSVHHVNAYQTSEKEIILDLCPTPFHNLRDYLKLETMMNPPTVSEWVSTNKDSEFTRFKINLDSGLVTSSTFDNTIGSRFINQFDFPVINERYRGKRYCVTYGWSAFDYSRTALVKKNVCDSTQDKVWYVENHYSTEPWFMERPGATDEEDGVVLSLVFDGEAEQSYLLLLDAVSFTPLARAYLPHNIPWSNHGMHFPEANFHSTNRKPSSDKQTKAKKSAKSETAKKSRSKEEL